MKIALFAFLVFVFCVVVAGSVSGTYFVPTEHSSLAPLISLDFGNQSNVMTSFYTGDRELFFDSIHRTGSIKLIAANGGNVLLGKLKLSKLNFSFNDGNVMEMPVALDGKPTLNAEATPDGEIALDYNVLSQECGGNYVLSFEAANTIRLNERRNVNLVVHIPCKTDLMIVLSPLMGQPSSEFLSAAKSYILQVAEQGKTAKLVTLADSDVAKPNVQDLSPTRLSFDLFNYPDRSENLLDDLDVEFSNNFSFDSRAVELKSEPVVTFFEKGVQTAAVKLPIEQTKKAYPVRDSTGHFNLMVTPEFFETEDRVAYILDYSLGYGFYSIHDRLLFIPKDCDSLRYFKPFPFSVFYGSSGHVPSLKGKSCADIEKMLPSVGKNMAVDGSVLKVVKRVNFKWVKWAHILYDGTFSTESALLLEQQKIAAGKVKNALDLLRLSYAPKYILLIGSVEHIQMGIELTEGNLQTTPSDSFYTYNAETNQIEVPIARIPVALDEQNPWRFASMVLRNAVANRMSIKPQSDKQLAMLFDLCGGTGNCFILKEVEGLSSKFSGPCTANNRDLNPRCLSSEPVCVAEAGKSGCSGNWPAINALDYLDYIYIDLHGSGYDLGAHNEKGLNLLVLNSNDISAAVKNTDLIVSNNACYGGSIDVDSNRNAITSSKSTVFAFLKMGSPLLLANTRAGYGINEKNLDSQRFAAILLASIKEKDSRPVGDVIVEVSNTLLSSKDSFERKRVWARQIYGDLLLPFYRAG